MSGSDSGGDTPARGRLARVWAAVVQPLTFLGLLLGSLLALSAVGAFVRVLLGPESGSLLEPTVFVTVGLAVVAASIVLRHRTVHLSGRYAVLDRFGL